MALTEDLKRFGLSDKEARVYLATLELGETPVQQISQKSGVNRATTYVVLDTLKERDLVKEMTEGKKRLFAALAPTALAEIVEGRKETLKDRRQKLSQLLPELRSATSVSGAKPRVKMYEGKEGVIAIHQDFLANGQGTILRFLPEKQYAEYLGNYRTIFRKERLARKLKVRAIAATKDTKRHGTVSQEHGGLTETLAVDVAEFPLAGGVDVYGNRTVFYALEEEVVGVVVEDQQIADTYRTLFELAWEGALT